MVDTSANQARESRFVVKPCGILQCVPSKENTSRQRTLAVVMSRVDRCNRKPDESQRVIEAKDAPVSDSMKIGLRNLKAPRTTRMSGQRGAISHATVTYLVGLDVLEIKVELITECLDRLEDISVEMSTRNLDSRSNQHICGMRLVE
jgi:hypothetical protein